MAYFHYNNKGIFPFSDECKDQELKNLAELDDSALTFVRETRRHAIDHSKSGLSPPLPSPPALQPGQAAVKAGGALTWRGVFAPVAENVWQDLWDGDDYENDYYFISQLFEPNWQPRNME